MTLEPFSCLNSALLRNFFKFFFGLRITLKSPFFTAPAPLYQSSKVTTAHPSNFFHPPLCIQPQRIFSSVPKVFIIPLQEQNPWRYHCDSGSCGAKFGGQVASPVGKLRINAPPKNPATIVIREPRAHRESGELVNSSVRQT